MTEHRETEPVTTPRLDALLARLSRRVVRQVWLHGLGTAFAGAAAWLAFAFLADWTMHLPPAVRVLHLIVLVALPSFLLWRELWRPLSRRPGRAHAAVLVERAHPELKELLVSAVQLGEPAGSGPSGDPVLIARVRGEAEARASALDLGGVLDPRMPRLRFAAGVAVGVLCAALLALNGDAAGIFFQRIAGSGVPWPKRTRLSIEVPVVAERGEVEEDGALIRVRVARKSDVPVVVRAEGIVPDEVTLHFSAGHEAVLASAGGDAFRTLLRSCQESLAFWATGGDDQDKEPLVEITVLQPPDVAGVAVEIRPPAYTGLAPRVAFDGDIEVLAGSELTVHVLPDPSDATGVVRILPEDRVIPLARSPYPAAPPAGPGISPDDASASDGAPVASADAAAGLAFEFVPEASLRYRFELQDASGLPNPDPGLFAVTVVEDRPPEVEVLSPGHGDCDTVLGGTIALRARAEDDFGIQSLSWSTAAPDDPSAASSEHPLELRPAPSDPERAASAAAKPRAAALALARLDVATLGGERPTVEGQQLLLTVSASDNRAPSAQSGRSPPVRVRVVTVDEFLRRVQDRLARVQGSASDLSELALEKHRRTLDLLAGLESDALPDASDSGELAAALIGQRRLLGDARAMTHEIASIVESVLYARIDDRAGALLEFVDQRLAQQTTRGFQAEPWRELTEAYAQGTLGSSGLSGRLCDILGLALAISEVDAAEAAQALDRAEEAEELAKMHAELDRAAAAQAAALVKIESLLEMLAEWDNFQSVLSLTRDILSRQRNLTERTRQYAKEN